MERLYMHSTAYGARLVACLLACSALGACGGSGGSSGGVGQTIPTIAPPPPEEPQEQPPLDGDPATFKTDEYAISWGLDAIKAAEAYAKGYTGDGVTIGLVDFNFDFASNEVNFHAASRGIDANLRAIYEAQIGDTASTRPHGQAVAVTAAGAKNDEGVHGVAFDAEVIAVDFFSGVNRFQTTDNGILLTVSQPYSYAFANGARVINKSLGFDEGDVISNPPEVDERYTLEFETNAIEAGALIVASAGNNSDPEPSLSNLRAINRLADSGTLNNGPGALIIAGSVDENLEISSFSDRAGGGPARFHYLVAPGERIVAPWEDEDGPGLFFLNGTSFSAPHITGAAALIFDRWPSLTAIEVANILYDTATDLGDPGVDAIYGRGLVNLEAALQPVGQSALSAPQQAVAISDSALILGPAFGDATDLMEGLSSVMILDAYGRDFHIDARGLVRAASGQNSIARALDMRRDQHASTLGVGRNQLNYSLHLDHRTAPAFALTGAAAESFSPDVQASFEFTGAFGETRWAVGTGRKLTEAIGRRPTDYRDAQGLSITGGNAGALPLGTGSYIAADEDLGDNTSFWIGTAVGNQQGLDHHQVSALRTDERTYSVAGRVEHYGKIATTGIEAGVFRETGTILGSRSAGGLQFSGTAQTVWFTLDARWSFDEVWTFMFEATGTLTDSEASGSSLFDQLGTLIGSRFIARLTRADMWRAGDRASLILHQPLRIERATANLWVGQSLDGEGTPIFDQQSFSLAPSGRELALEFAYGSRLEGNWYWEANAAHRFDADHVRGRADTLFLIGLARHF